MNTQAVNDLVIQRSPVFRPAGSQPDPASALNRAQNAGAPTPQAPPELVRMAAEGVNAFLRLNGTHIQFAMHEKAKELMVEVIDDATNEVIKTIPPKELLDLAAKIGELVGALLDRRE
jgi:flagellar protein FlaG